MIGAPKIARDISAEQTSQQELARLYEQLKELNARKDEFIALASHELKTPLTSARGYLQILAQRVTDEKNVVLSRLWIPDKVFNYFPVGNRHLNGSEVTELVEHLSHYRDNPGLWPKYQG